MELGKIIFDEKTVSDVIKDAYKKHDELDKSIQDKIDLLTTFINTPGDAIVIIPLISELKESQLKNNETLMKIVQLFKQPVAQKTSEKEEESGLLTEKDIEQLFYEVNTKTTGQTKLLDK